MSAKRQNTQLLSKQSSSLEHGQDNKEDTLQRQHLQLRNKSPTPRHVHTSKFIIMEIEVSYSQTSLQKMDNGISMQSPPQGRHDCPNM